MKKYALPIKYGVFTSAGLILYFLTLSLLGLHTNVFYSLFNGVITGIGIYEAIRVYRANHPNDFGYGQGFSAGILTGFIATLLFTFFFALYATELNTNFLAALSAAWFSHIQSFEGIVFFTVAIMGFATSLVLTLSFMQLFKTSNNLRRRSI